ncbi:hypothetical protein OG875_19195 [Streptomyces sp. NBC_01498]|uniref:hypothetical protein n=1 Tax=Streptomyces sp. NBC_01498 TaxID=2975870 RepID=UPI002E7B8C5A|nr:hypothetical protein [Streptomyces sp. NBC_01498]WTL26516.1 hypothetical protein OG875_19195 [Streptomyces sp. NBC_01498]
MTDRTIHGTTDLMTDRTIHGTTDLMTDRTIHGTTDRTTDPSIDRSTDLHPGETVKQGNRIATTLAAVAVLGAVGVTTAGPASAAGLVRSWGPFNDSKGLAKGSAACQSAGKDGAAAKKWKTYTCAVEPGKDGKYVRLYVK